MLSGNMYPVLCKSIMTDCIRYYKVINDVTYQGFVLCTINVSRFCIMYYKLYYLSRFSIILYK